VKIDVGSKRRPGERLAIHAVANAQRSGPGFGFEFDLCPYPPSISNWWPALRQDGGRRQRAAACVLRKLRHADLHICSGSLARIGSGTARPWGRFFPEMNRVGFSVFFFLGNTIRGMVSFGSSGLLPSPVGWVRPLEPIFELRRFGRRDAARDGRTESPGNGAAML